jgi:hypothetical protein
MVTSIYSEVLLPTTVASQKAVVSSKSRTVSIPKALGSADADRGMEITIIIARNSAIFLIKFTPFLRL